MLLNLFFFLIMISIIVSIHELGHYLFARFSNIAIEEFSIGFGPRIFRTNINNNQTVFSIRMLPLGGFVKPLKEFPKNNLNSKDTLFEESSSVKKILMVAGGPLFNFILAFILLCFANIFIGNKELPATLSEVKINSIFYKSGLRENDTIESINDVKIRNLNQAYREINTEIISGREFNLKTDTGKDVYINGSDIDLSKLGDNLNKIIGINFKGPMSYPIVKKVYDGSSAANAKIVNGDVIVKLGDYEGNDFNKYLRIIKENPEKEFNIQLNRNGEIFNTKILTTKDKFNGETIGSIGVEMYEPIADNYILNKDNLIDGIINSAIYLKNSTLMTITSIKRIILGEISTKAISGPISIATYSGKSAEKGIYSFILLTAVISIGVGVFNLIPLPVLDGGHIITYTLELIFKMKIPEVVLHKFQVIGIIALAALFCLAIVNDVSKIL